MESLKTTAQQGSTERRVCKPKEGMDGPQCQTPWCFLCDIAKQVYPMNRPQAL